MLHVFSDLEGIRIAAEMERRGEAFYRRAAKVSKSEATVNMLLSLAGDEQVHCAEFERLYAKEEAKGMSGKAYDDETNAYLTAVAAEVVFPKGLVGLADSGFEDPVAVLRYAIASEKDSIMFYSELRNHASDEHAGDIFSEVTRQERGHLYRLQRQLNQILESEE